MGVHDIEGVIVVCEREDVALFEDGCNVVALLSLTTSGDQGSFDVFDARHRSRRDNLGKAYTVRR